MYIRECTENTQLNESNVLIYFKLGFCEYGWPCCINNLIINEIPSVYKANNDAFYLASIYMEARYT